MKGDNSVLAVVFTDESGDYYLHRVEYISNPPLPWGVGWGEGLDAATYQCRRIAQLAKELYLPSLTVEANGIGKFLPGLLKNKIALAKTPCAVSEINNNKPKDLRILEAFDAPLAARRIHVHASVLKTPLLTEMTEWRPGISNAHDDGLDAVAGALAQAPVRLKRIYGKGAHNWPRGRKNHKAKTEFEI